MQVRVAIVQAEPVYLDLGASVARAVELTADAAARGARLVVFGETWLPGYPYWVYGAAYHGDASDAAFARLWEESVEVPSPATDALAAAAAAHDVHIVIGIDERAGGTLYNSLLYLGPEGVLGVHRKLVPTSAERTVWGQGDGSTLHVFDTPLGRLGGLVCWEHWMPLARQALHVAGEQIHVALWPTVKESHQLASRHYAFEGRCFVLAAGTLMRARDLPAELASEGDPARWLLRGGSAIAGPDGAWITEPLFDEEAIVFANLELDAIDRERLTLDVTGHYSRPDVFEFRVRR